MEFFILYIRNNTQPKYQKFLRVSLGLTSLVTMFLVSNPGRLCSKASVSSTRVRDDTLNALETNKTATGLAFYKVQQTIEIFCKVSILFLKD